MKRIKCSLQVDERRHDDLVGFHGFRYSFSQSKKVFLGASSFPEAGVGLGDNVEAVTFLVERILYLLLKEFADGRQQANWAIVFRKFSVSARLEEHLYSCSLPNPWKIACRNQEREEFEEDLDNLVWDTLEQTVGVETGCSRPDTYTEDGTRA